MSIVGQMKFSWLPGGFDSCGGLRLGVRPGLIVIDVNGKSLFVNITVR